MVDDSLYLVKRLAYSSAATSNWIPLGLFPTIGADFDF
jgi:hypothetical protein